ncbi:MAG: sulfopyruvate decarboxylase subunit beta [Dehalococcoidia bacterium]|nr:sulfopyruvate decarboxylase subunit beta [Dehalococcoidia bacterium]
MFRYEATQMILGCLQDQPLVTNLGPTTDELWAAGHRDRNFYTFGSMGLCSSIALGMALSLSEKVISLDGDGSLLMNLGTIASIGREQPSNLIVVVWDNEEWAQTGRQKSHTAFGTNLEAVARSCNITHTKTVTDLTQFKSVFKESLTTDGPWFIVAKIEEGELYPLMPQEPDATLLRFRATYLS